MGLEEEGWEGMGGGVNAEPGYELTLLYTEAAGALGRVGLGEGWSGGPLEFACNMGKDGGAGTSSGPMRFVIRAACRAGK